MIFLKPRTDILKIVISKVTVNVAMDLYVSTLDITRNKMMTILGVLLESTTISLYIILWKTTRLLVCKYRNISITNKDFILTKNNSFIPIWNATFVLDKKIMVSICDIIIELPSKNKDAISTNNCIFPTITRF